MDILMIEVSETERRKFNREFKIKVIRLVTESKPKTAEVAYNLGIPRDLIYKLERAIV